MPYNNLNHRTQASLRQYLLTLSPQTIMKNFVYLINIILLFVGNSYAVSYDCPASQKIDNENGFFPKDKLDKYQFSVRVHEEGGKATLERCSFSTLDQKVTCDSYKVDKIVRSLNGEIKKYYVLQSHFDVQIFSDLKFVENNGRMTISFGKCHIVAP